VSLAKKVWQETAKSITLHHLKRTVSKSGGLRQLPGLVWLGTYLGPPPVLVPYLSPSFRASFRRDAPKYPPILQYVSAVFLLVSFLALMTPLAIPVFSIARNMDLRGMQGKAINNGNLSCMIRVSKCKPGKYLKIRPSCNGLAHSCTYLSSLLVNNRCSAEFSSLLRSPYDGSRRLILSSMSLIHDTKGLHCQMASPSG